MFSANYCYTHHQNKTKTPYPEGRMSSIEINTRTSDTKDSADILVVDDDPTQSMALKTMLEKKGYTVLETNNGKDAVSIFKQYHPDMVLLDAVMPDMDGFETCRHIRSIEEGKNTLILMVTGLNDDDSVKQAFNAGAIDYITKPIDWSVLLGRVGYMLQAKNSAQKIRKIEDQLRHAQKMESIGNLTNGIAHNFNNILSSIMGYTELLLDTYMKDAQGKQLQYIQQIYNSGKRASALVSQMQAFTSNGIGHPEILRPSTLLNETVQMLHPTLPKSIKLHYHSQEDLPPMEMDAVQFQQVIMNLLINARDAMDNKGSIDITLQKVEIEKIYCASCHHEINGQFIELSIGDTGTGITDNVLMKMFDPYFSSKPFGQSSGLGLSVVHGIVHEYDGHILVETEQAEGTLFKILFPVTHVDFPVIEENEEVEEYEHLEPEFSKHILIVDDEGGACSYKAEFLQSYGYKTTVMTDPIKAMELITTDPYNFDLVITDKVMPGLDGLELSSAIMAVRADLPIILCTGYSGLLPDLDLQGIGIRAQLDKQIDRKKLLRTLKTILEKI